MGQEFLTIRLDDAEYWDEVKEEFISNPGKEVTFRYTLKNLDKWESKYKKKNYWILYKSSAMKI